MKAHQVDWPNFYIVGAVKSGTTSLYARLKKHPQVFLPEMKEPHYFASSPVPAHLKHEHCTGDLDAYMNLYRGSEGYKAIGDASPSYLWDEAAPRRIHEVAPHARIIAILRDPIDRAYSEYLMAIMNGSDSLPLLEALKTDYAREKKDYWIARLYVELGMYHDQLKRYFDIFGKEQVLVLLFEDLVKSPEQTYARIAAHLGIDPGKYEASENPLERNAYRMPRFLFLYHLLVSPTSRSLRRRLLPDSVRKWMRNSAFLQYNSLLFGKRKPPLDAESRDFLQGIFEPEVLRLEKLLMRDLPELRKTWAVKSEQLAAM